MAEISIGSSVNSSLHSLLMCDDMVPGSDLSYQTAKTIYSYHPLGGKIVDAPIKLAMSQKRRISVPNGPQERIVDAFEKKWKAIKADHYIANTMRLSRIYGVAALVYGAPDLPTDKPIPPEDLATLELYFNALDPLNTAGSLVLNQNPNAPDFQKPVLVTASGQPYHPSRSCIIMNEDPIYIEYTTSAFGFVGRSAYQRALFPLKSFVQSMITDDMVTRKAGVIVAKMKPAGSIADKMMSFASAIKRNVVKEAQTNNVINITPDEEISTLNMQNTDTAMTTARQNILHNIAAATPMPAKLLNNESYAEGFGEGSEDAKDVVRYVEGIRSDMQPLYDYFDRIVRYQAWTPEFYEAIQNEFEEYKDVSYTEAFYDWVNNFSAEWPSLLVEPESKLVEVEDVKLKAIMSLMEVMGAQADPENKARIMQWAADNINENKHMFTAPLLLDYEAMANYTPPEPMQSPNSPMGL